MNRIFTSSIRLCWKGDSKISASLKSTIKKENTDTVKLLTGSHELVVIDCELPSKYSKKRKQYNFKEKGEDNRKNISLRLQKEPKHENVNMSGISNSNNASKAQSTNNISKNPLNSSRRSMSTLRRSAGLSVPLVSSTQPSVSRCNYLQNSAKRYTDQSTESQLRENQYNDMKIASATSRVSNTMTSINQETGESVTFSVARGPMTYDKTHSTSYNDINLYRPDLQHPYGIPRSSYESSSHSAYSYGALQGNLGNDSCTHCPPEYIASNTQSGELQTDLQNQYAFDPFDGPGKLSFNQDAIEYSHQHENISGSISYPFQRNSCDLLRETYPTLGTGSVGESIPFSSQDQNFNFPDKI